MSAGRTGRRRATVRAGQALRDSRGQLIDEAYVDGAVTEALVYARGRGRPSLSAAGESPVLRVRVSQDLDAAIRTAARDSGQTVAEWARWALEVAAVRQQRVDLHPTVRNKIIK